MATPLLMVQVLSPFRARAAVSSVSPSLTPPHIESAATARRGSHLRTESPHCSVSAGGRRLENLRHHLSRNRLLHDSRPRCRYFDSGYRNHSRDCAASHYCVLLDHVRVCSTCPDPSGSAWRKNSFARPLRAPIASRDHSTYCLAHHLAVPVSTPNSNCRYPTSASCRSDRAGRRCRLYPHKRCHPWPRRNHRRLVHDEKSFLPDLHG